MKFILGNKVEMTQVWKGEDRKAVTKIQTGPCKVIQIKNKETDGYEAVQIGFGEKKEKNISKPQKGHLKKLGNFRYLREFRLDRHKADKTTDLKVGDVIDINTFKEGDVINITSISKGKGFQGVVKRHGFHGQNKTHGTKDQLRMPGSAGATGPAHVFKGMRMPGRMGTDRVTIINAKVVDVLPEENAILVEGGVAGARNSLVMITGRGELKIQEEKKTEKVEEVKPEETKAEETPVVEKVKEEKAEEPKVEEKKEEAKEEIPAEENKEIAKEEKVEEKKEKENKEENK